MVAGSMVPMNKENWPLAMKHLMTRVGGRLRELGLSYVEIKRRCRAVFPPAEFLHLSLSRLPSCLVLHLHQDRTDQYRCGLLLEDKPLGEQYPKQKQVWV